MLRRTAFALNVLCVTASVAKVGWANEAASGIASAPSFPGESSAAQESALLAAGQKLEGMGQLGAAEADYRKALALREARLGKMSPDLAEILHRLASILRKEGKSSAAEQLLRRTVDLDRKVVPANPLPVAAQLDDLHAVLAERGKWAAAADVAKMSLQIKETALGPGNPSVTAAHALVAHSEEIAKRTIPPPPPAPSATPAPTVAAPYDELDQALASMRSTPIAYDPPTAMNVGDTRVLTLVMSPSSSVDAIQKTLRDRGAIDPQGTAVKYAPRMQAHLAGAAFQIDAVTPESQAVSASAATEWRWQVTAQKEGIQPLELSLNAQVTIAGGDTEYAIKTFDQSIEVKITGLAVVEAFVSEHVEWLFGLIVVPLAGLFWRKLRAARSSRSVAPQPEGGASGRPGTGP